MKQKTLRRSALATAISASLGFAAIFPGTAQSDTYVWGALTGAASSTATCGASPDASEIIFTMLDAAGAPLANSSTAAPTAKNPSNQLQTTTCGTLTYDTDTDTGSMEIGAFDFFSGSLPAVATGVVLENVGDGSGGAGTLFLANMLFNWNGENGIPVSAIFDAQGLLGEMDGTPSTFSLNADGSLSGAATDLTGIGAVPASDGIYVGPNANVQNPPLGDGPGSLPGYLALGPVPVATTAWNTNLAPGCTIGSCQGVSPSGALPLVEDPLDTPTDYTDNTGAATGVSGIGGHPMADGAFQGSNANFDVTSMKLISFTDTTPPDIALVGADTVLVVTGDLYTEQGATCSDLPPLPTAPISVPAPSESPTLDTNTVGDYDLTYTCTDGSGLMSQVVRTVQVRDPNALITLIGNSTVTHECATPYVDAGATCNDPGVGGDGDIIGPNDPLSGNDFSLDQSNVDANLGTPGTGYTATWSCTDSDTNTNTADRTVNITDTTDPVVTLQGANPQQIASSTADNTASYVDPQATVTDSCDMGITSPFSSTGGAVDMTVPDTGPATLPNTISYTATDAGGNSHTVNRTVEVTRSQPVISLAGNAFSIVVNVGDAYVEEGFTITDAQDGDVTTAVTSSGPCGTGMTCTIDASAVNVNAAGNYTVTYDVSDSDGNNATTVNRTVIVGAYAVNSNFTMLDGSGNVFGGTNDVVFAWDNSEYSDPSTDLLPNMIIATSTPTFFFAFVWDAHSIRAFGPGDYWFDTSCTRAQVAATGCGTTTDPSDPTYIHMHVPAGQVGAHMLFDWNTTDDIDVVNVWEKNGVWADADGQVDVTNLSSPATAKNDLHMVDNIVTASNPNGCGPEPTTNWLLVSTDLDGDGNNASKMIDGPFSGSYANFNAGPSAYQATCENVVKVSAPDTSLSDSTIASFSLIGLLTGLLSLFGLRFASRKQ